MALDDTPVARLIQALRSPLPEGFEWDFCQYKTCAAGLADQLGIDRIAVIDALPPGTVMTIFDHPFIPGEIDGLVPLYGVPARDVTPTMVADALERLIAP
jgi:hypothetical protein